MPRSREFPTDPGLYNLLGVVEAQRGNRSAAEADFRRALAYAPESTGALLNLGRLYLDDASQDPEGAERRRWTPFRRSYATNRTTRKHCTNGQRCSRPPVRIRLRSIT